MIIDKANLENFNLNQKSDEFFNSTSKNIKNLPFYMRKLFLLIVIIPTLFSILYFGIIANDIYISESHFVVRNPSRGPVNPIGALLNSGGGSGPSEEANAVIEYIESRDALKTLDKDGLVRRAYGSNRAAWLDRFGTMLTGSSDEHLYVYINHKVTVEIDPSTQVTRLKVQAFNPADAKEINRRLIEQSEDLVNRMSRRAQGDAIAVAETEVKQAQDRARAAAIALSKFRIERGVVDPKQESEIRLQMISKLQNELIATRTQLQQMLSFTPSASQIAFLRTQQDALKREIIEQTKSISGTSNSLSGVAVRYQELLLASELAEKLLAASVVALEDAKADARRKRAYVERVSEPSSPDHAMQPRRLRGIVSTLLLTLLAWGIASMLLSGIREHYD